MNSRLKAIPSLLLMLSATAASAQRTPRFYPTETEVELAARDPADWLLAGILIVLVINLILLQQLIKALSSR